MPRQHEALSADRALPGFASVLDERYGALPARDLIAVAAQELFRDRLALVTSFGAESVVLLHLAASVDPALPVVFVDTLRLFPETLAYRDRLISELGLRDVRTISPSAEEESLRDPMGALFATDPDACCGFRKVAPLERALVPFSAWITGRKRFQAGTRAALPTFEAEAGRIKINPLAGWSAADLLAYLRQHALARHPLVDKGYPSIGCAPCTTPVAEGEESRSGRWRGVGKTECGIHRAPTHSSIGGA